MAGTCEIRNQWETMVSNIYSFFVHRYFDFWTLNEKRRLTNSNNCIFVKVHARELYLNRIGRMFSSWYIWSRKLGVKKKLKVSNFLRVSDACMWRMHICGGCMHVPDAWMCRMHGCAGCMHVPDACTCRMHACAGCIHVSDACICRMHAVQSTPVQSTVIVGTRW